MGTSIFTGNRKEDKKALKTNEGFMESGGDYIKVKGEWKYLYRAIDSDGNTIDFMLSQNEIEKLQRDSLRKLGVQNHNQMPRVITVDRNPAYPIAIEELKNEKKLSENVKIRQVKYLNNIVEQDHRSIKRIIAPMLSFQSFRFASKILKGIEALNMVKKGQVKNLNYSGLDEAKYINQLFGIVL